jgi:DNA-binding transcriptional LysR family regulator
MDIRQFRAFLAVIETGSLNKASQLLHVSQPALTKRIRRMEEQLGVRLFDRGARGMQPTPYAETLRSYAQAATSGMEQVLARIAALKSGTRGTLTVAGAPLTASTLFPEALVALKQERPEFDVRIVSQSRSLREGLLARDYELIATVLDEDASTKGLTQHFLFNDRLVIVARPGHRLLKGKKLTPEILQRCSWVYAEQNTWHRSRLQRYFEEAGLALPVATIECRAPAILKAIVACSDHVGLVTRLGVQAEVSAGVLEMFEIDSPLMARPIGLFWRERDALSPPAKAFIAILERICRRRKWA